MLILSVRTDKPEAEIGLFEDTKQIAYKTWQAHRELSETIHKKVGNLLKSQKKDWKDIESIVCFKGPGSFTGLRIGLTVANTLAYGLAVPIVSSEGKDWIQKGIKRLQSGEDEHVALPDYGTEVHTTKPRK